MMKRILEEVKGRERGAEGKGEERRGGEGREWEVEGG